MNGPALNTDPRDPVAEELHLMKTAGIVEVASRNPNVAEWVRHWGDRALKAETAVAAARAEGMREAARIAENYQEWAANWAEHRNQVAADAAAKEIASAIRAEASK